MTRKTNIPVTSRDIYFTPAGDDTWSGASPETAVTSPEEAIARVNALVPSPTPFTPASINASQTGSFTSGVVMPDATSASASFASILTTDAINLEVGSLATNRWGALRNFADNGVNVMVDGITRSVIDVNSIIVGSDGSLAPETTNNTGIKTTGNCDDIFFECRQLVVNGNNSTGIYHDAETTTPARYSIDNFEFFNDQQVCFHLNSADPFELIELNLVTARESAFSQQSMNNTTIFLAESGIISVVSQSLQAQMIGHVKAGGRLGLLANTCVGGLIVETGGSCLIRDTGLWIGDIEVEAGASMDCIIQAHVGTITNNGTINGIINGRCYGSYCHDIQTQSGHGFYQSPANSAAHPDAQAIPNATPTIFEVVEPYAIEDERLPFGSTQPLWDPVASIITPDQELGEWIARVTFTAEAAQTDRYLTVRLRFGGGGTVIDEQNVRMVKAANVPQPIGVTFPFFGSIASLTDGLEVEIEITGTSVVIYNQAVYISKTGGEL